MQRNNETKASASRMEFYLLIILFFFGGTGFFLSLATMTETSPEERTWVLETAASTAYLTKVKETGINCWNTFEINEYEITKDTEIETYPETGIKIYASRMIGLYFEERGRYEISFRSKANNKIIFRETIKL